MLEENNEYILFLLAYTQTLFYFSFRSFRRHRRARSARSVYFRLPPPLLPAVYFLSPALDGLWRENRGSVNWGYFPLYRRISIFCTRLKRRKLKDGMGLKLGSTLPFPCSFDNARLNFLMDKTLLSQHSLLHDLVLYTWLMYFFTDQPLAVPYNSIQTTISSGEQYRK